MAVVYRHIRLDTNQPFYIGIGVAENRAYSKTHRNKHWMAIIKNTEYRVDILFDDISYSLAKEKEVEFIEIYKRKQDGGSLCNITKGGDGVLGLRHSHEARIKMGLPNKGKTISERHRKIISDLHKGRKMSDEVRFKISEKTRGAKNHRYGKKASKETVEKMKASAKRGEENKTSKLSEKDVLLIREIYKSGTSQRKIANQFGVYKGTIRCILNGKTWGHI